MPALIVLLVAGCGRHVASSTSGAAGPLHGSLTVLAAASLADALDRDKAALAGAGVDLTLSFAGSQQVVRQVEDGAPADVVVTADRATMQQLVDRHLIETPRDIATNRLEIAVAAGNPKHVAGLADLARPDLAVVLADAAVPAGKYAAKVLGDAGVTVRPRSLELDVRSALQKVAIGEADAAIVYATDVRSAPSAVTGVAIPTDQNIVASYPAAVVRGSSRSAAAAAFVEDLLHGGGAAALRDAGFGSP